MTEETNSQALIYSQKGETKLYRDIIRSHYFKGGDKNEVNLALVFCLAVVLGVNEKKFKPLTNKEYITRTEVIKKNNHMYRFLESVAINHTSTLNVVNNSSQVFEIAEGYANEGITILYSKVFNHNKQADFDKELEYKFNLVAKKIV